MTRTRTAVNAVAGKAGQFLFAPHNDVADVLQNVTIRRLTVRSPDGPNCDGIVIDSSRNVLVEDCDLHSNGDCVALKSGMNEDGCRVGKPTDIAEIVAWLLDGERSGFVTGANFVVDGGMTRKMIYEE